MAPLSREYEVFNAFSVIGIGYLGVVASSALYGLTCVQTYRYYSILHRMDRWLKLWVAVLFLLDTVHQAFITHAFYYYLISNYGNPISLLTTVWSLVGELIVNNIIALIVECLVIIRLWDLSNNKPLVAACVLLSLSQCGSTMLYPIRASLIENRANAEQTLETIGIAGLAVASITNVTLCASLSYYFQRNRTGFRKPDNVIERLILLTITTGLFTTFCCIAQLISYAIRPVSFYPLFFNFMLGKLYINALLTSLGLHRGPEYMQKPDNPPMDSVPFHSLTHQNLSDGRPITVAVQQVVEEEMNLSLKSSNTDEIMNQKGPYKMYESDIDAKHPQ